VALVGHFDFSHVDCRSDCFSAGHNWIFHAPVKTFFVALAIDALL
jgi:hypothetical protein